jgi:hypothetical protein
MGEWTLTSTVAFWRINSWAVSNILRKSTRISFFNRIMILSIRAKKQHPGSKITRFRSWTGQLNPQISTLLSIFRFTSKDSL